MVSGSAAQCTPHGVSTLNPRPFSMSSIAGQYLQFEAVILTVIYWAIQSDITVVYIGSSTEMALNWELKLF